MDKLERQLGLLATLLHTGRPLRAAEIHQLVEGYPDESGAFRRAFERDKDDLRRLGIPLEVIKTETSDGSVDGYRVNQKDYYLHDLGLEPDEVVALSMALRLIRLEGVTASDAVWKLGGAAVEDPQTPELAAIAIGPAVTELHEAINARATVGFDYRGERREVEPWRLAFRRGHWYLNGWDRVRGDERSFRLDRIVGALEVGRPGSAQASRAEPRGERRPWQFGVDDEPATRATVAIDADHARWARLELVGADIDTRPDGSIVARLDVTNVAAFRSMVLSMFEAAEILAPDELRRDLIEWLEAMA